VKEFPNEQLTVSAGKVFYEACREELSIKKSIKDILHHQNPEDKKRLAATKKSIIRAYLG